MLGLRNLRVGVIGLGYVGLPLAVEFGRHFRTVGFDIKPERVRWVGGYGRMDDVGNVDLASADPDPTAPGAQRAVDHLNEDHADALLAMARALGGYPDALAARCTTVDRYGLNLAIETPRGHAPSRVGFAETVNDPAGLRAATVELTRLARS